MTDTVYIDIRASPLTMAQVTEAVKKLQQERPDEEIFMNGDLYAIVGRKKVSA